VKRSSPVKTIAISSILTTCLLGNSAWAALTIYLSEISFNSGASPTQFESFESLAPRGRTSGMIDSTLFDLTPATSLIGIQGATDSPESGNGAFASDGDKYLLSYVPGMDPGSFVIQFPAPVLAVGFTLIDLGEVASTITAQTGVGETLNPVLLDSVDGLPNGNTRFIGFKQDTPFDQVTFTFTGLDESFGMDAVRIAVPEPYSLSTLAVSLLVFASHRRRK
jgi:hypothetical protein